MRRVIPAAAVMLLLWAAWAASAETPSPRISLQGYDTVAYFTEGRPVKGSATHHYDWDGARYYFASGKNRDLFAANPDRFAPQFSGLCAAGLAYGKFLEADPTVWKIVDGKLYVFGGPNRLAMHEKDPNLLARSHANWKAARR